MSNEPIHPFFSDKPEDITYTKAYQQGFIDGLKTGREQGVRMLNDYLSRLHSVIGDAIIKEIREKIQKVDEQ